MANQEHLDILKQGVKVWNKWRDERGDSQEIVAILQRKDNNSQSDRFGMLSQALFGEVDLSEIELSGNNFSEMNFIAANLSMSTLRNANFTRAELLYANLYQADLEEADFTLAELGKSNFSNANLRKANFVTATLTGSVLRSANLQDASLLDAHLDKADLRNADLRWADLSGATFHDADLRGADLRKANLVGTSFVGTNLEGANLTGCLIHGTSVWNAHLENAIQANLVITDENEPTITVDNLEVAQFIYLLLHNEKIRDVIDTITSKVVLILGGFTSERKIILEAIREELRKRNYIPVLFDFEKPANRDITETVSTLAHMARFVIADITDAKSIPQELMTIVPNLPSVPVQPLILNLQHEYGMFEHFTRYPWVLPVYRYTDEASLLKSLKEKVIDPAVEKTKDLAKR